MALDQYLLCFNYAINQSPPNFLYLKHAAKLAQGASIGGGDAIVTVGTSTTVSAVNNGSPFAGCQPGGLIIVYTGDPATTAPTIVHVVTVTSPNQITVDVAINLSNGGLGYSSWFYRDFWSGGSAGDVTSGWVMLSKWSQLEVQVVAGTVQATGGLDMSIETRGLWQRPAADNIQILNTVNFPAGAAVAANFVITEICPFLRVGFKAHTTAQAGENLTVKLVGRWSAYND